jgi:hypothetical protein
MARTSKLMSLTALAIVAVALAACSGAAAGGPGSSPIATPMPSEAPVVTPAPVQPTPVVTPVPVETPVVTPAPVDPGTGDGGGDAMPIKVDLENATGHDVYVDIVDRSGTIVGASSGTPAEGVSVATGSVDLKNLDDRTVQLTWSTLTGDNALALYVDESGDTMILVQPPLGGDLMPHDMVLVLEFDAPVSADDLRVSIQEGVDTPG